MLDLIARRFGALFSDTPQRAPARPRLVWGRFPEAPIYAIGDVHGRLDLLIEAERRILADAAVDETDALVVMLGDYVDRGPESAGVLDHLARPAPEGLRRVCLCGNHEEEMLRFLRDPGSVPDWPNLGGDRTLMSYGFDVRGMIRDRRLAKLTSDVLLDVVPDAHLNFLAGLPSALRVGRYLFVHAGVRPGIPLEQQDDLTLMTIREPFLSRGPEMDLVVVHGHTPTTQVDFGKGRVGIDLGGYASGELAVLKVFENSVAELADRPALDLQHVTAA